MEFFKKERQENGKRPKCRSETRRGCAAPFPQRLMMDDKSVGERKGEVRRKVWRRERETQVKLLHLLKLGSRIIFLTVLSHSDTARLKALALNG
jgi:hypothetical protein